MAEIIKKKLTSVKSAIPVKKKTDLVKAVIVGLNLSLPETMSTPKTDFLAYSYLLYGRKKIGKTSLASCFPDCFFLMTEPGAESLKVFQRPIKNWKEFVGYLDLLDQNKTRFKTLVLDIGDPLYTWCLSYVCAKQGIDHPNEVKDFGQTWNAINTEFQKQLTRLLPMNSGRGLVVLSHEKSIEIEVAGSVFKLERIIPTMEKHTLEFFNGKVDTIAYYTFKGKERIIIIRGDEKLESGCRLKYNFLTPNNERVKVIRAGNSEEQCFNNLKLAFENKQTTSGEVAENKVPVTNTLVKKNK